MKENIKLKLNADELRKIYQENMDIIEKELLQIEEVLKTLEKDPNALTITQMKTLYDREVYITERLQDMVETLRQSKD